MANIEIYSVGKIKTDWLADGIAHYTKLLSKYRKLDSFSIKEAAKGVGPREAVADESSRVLQKFAEDGFNIVLDAGGKGFSSEAFAAFLQKLESRAKTPRFFIGGAFGFSDEVKGKADLSLALSRMTLPHEVTSLVLLEQLYRAHSILVGGKYHK